VEQENAVRENTQLTSPYRFPEPTLADGVSVTGEAVRRVAPESAEFLLEITTSSPTAAQALRDNKARTAQLMNALGPLGVQAADAQTISFQVLNLYSPLLQGIPGYPNVPPQLAAVGFSPQPPGTAGQAEVQFNPYDLQLGAYHARNTMRVLVREAGRVGEVADAAVKSGANILGGFCIRAADEAATRRAALEAAAKDARTKAEALASAAGKQLGDPIAVSEDIVASNGTYMALRAANPWAFGAGAPQTAGELEFYARVSARFGLA